LPPHPVINIAGLTCNYQEIFPDSATTFQPDQPTWPEISETATEPQLVQGMDIHLNTGLQIAGEKPARLQSLFN